MIYCNISISLELSGLIAFVGTVLIIVILWCLLLFTKSKRRNYDVTCFEISSLPCITLRMNNEDRQIAFKILADIKTRTIGVKVDLEKDNIKVVNDSYHDCFISTRELIKEIPVNKLENNQNLFKWLTDFLNNLLRPYLTKWGVAYTEWYEMAKKENESLSKNDKNKYKTFIQIQREFPQYEELVKDLLDINKKVEIFVRELEKIAFNKE